MVSMSPIELVVILNKVGNVQEAWEIPYYNEHFTIRCWFPVFFRIQGLRHVNKGLQLHIIIFISLTITLTLTLTFSLSHSFFHHNPIQLFLL